MDEITRRALEAFRESESSAIGINRRRMLEAFEATQTVQARAALEAFRAFETSRSKAALGVFKSFEAIQSRAALDVIRNMPAIPRTALDAIQGTIDQTIRATPFLDAMRESERQIAALFRHKHTAAIYAISAVTDAIRT